MRIGIDLGGTKIEAVAIDREGRPRFRRRIATPRGDYDATLRAIAALVAAAEEVTGAARVGIGIPGAISPATGLVKNANSVWLNGRSLADDLSRLLERPVRLANDANCFALSEASDGAGAGGRTVFGAIIGTGTGAGVVVDGRVLVGPNAIAGEWGHNPLPWPRAGEWPGPACYCGHTGCIETFLSGPALAREAAGDGHAVEAPQVAAAADAGEPWAALVMERYCDRMARAFASIINVLDPDVIVLGGGLSNIDRLYTEVPARWDRWTFSDRVTTALKRAAHGDASGVRGAAWLWSTDESG
ncbi:MAG TPA: ROK family protein [Vicinamibacterales bacterium]|nr:ROK family protein [Vicinamibacterales bacterium]